MEDGPRIAASHDDAPFFIVGSGRSGTTLLQSLLSGHPRLTVPPETHYMKRAMSWGADARDAPADFDAFWADLTGWSRFADLGVDADDVLARLDRCGGRTFRGVLLAMLAAYGGAHGAARTGEKTPSHYRHVGRLLSWYPQARVLFVRRDPRAVIASHLPTPWVTGQMRPPSRLASFSRRSRLVHVAERAALWRQANGRFLAACEHDPRVHVVAYEALVTAPHEELEAVCDFLGERYEAAMLADRGGTARPGEALAERGDGFQDWRRGHRAAAGSAVTRSGLAKWRTALSALEVAMVEAVCGPTMRPAGYEPETRGTLRMAGRVLAGLCLTALHVEDGMRGSRERY